MGLKRPQFLALLGALAVVVLLVVLPRTPSGKSAAAVKALSPTEVKMAEAIALVQGQDPMRGIMMLREVVEQDPDNAEAHWHLGLFSIQSGQYEKALDRFRKVRELDAGKFPDVWFYLGRTYATLDSTEQAIECLRKYRTLTTDTVILDGVDRFLMELEGNEQH